MMREDKIYPVTARANANVSTALHDAPVWDSAAFLRSL